MAQIYIFSKSLAAERNVGDLMPDFQKLFPNAFSTDFRPIVFDKYQAIAPGVISYKDGQFTHYVEDPTSAISGVILGIQGPPRELDTYMQELDALDKAYGLERKTRRFIRLDPLSMVESNIYIAESKKDIKVIEGPLERITENLGLISR